LCLNIYDLFKLVRLTIIVSILIVKGKGTSIEHVRMLTFTDTYRKTNGGVN